MNKPVIFHLDDAPQELMLCSLAFVQAAVEVEYRSDHCPDHAKQRWIDEAAPDLILLDVQMNRKSGLDVLRDIRSTPRLRNVPVVVLTNLAKEDDRAACRDIGARDYLEKPDSIAGFIELAERLAAIASEHATVPSVEKP